MTGEFEEVLVTLEVTLTSNPSPSPDPSPDLVVARDAHGLTPAQRVGHARVAAELPMGRPAPLLRRVEVEAVDALVEVAGENGRPVLVGADTHLLRVRLRVRVRGSGFGVRGSG